MQAQSPPELEPLSPIPAPRHRASVRSPILRRLFRHRIAVVSAIVLLLIALSAIFAPFLAPYPLGEPNLNALLEPPSWQHLMGTDALGVDVFTEVLYGGRISLEIGLSSALLGVSLGGVIGALAGYFGGFLDTLLMRATDVALSIPTLFVILVAVRLVGGTPASIITIIALTSWMYPARLMRGQVLTVREREYVEAAKAEGATPLGILWRHLVPNAIAPLIVNATLLSGQAIVIEATLDFLGAGLGPPNVSWGLLLNEAQSNLTNAPWLALFPSAMIFLVVLCMNLLGDGLRDALDPTTQG